MPFDAFELSRWGGKPVHLFIFQRQSLLWRFANAEQDLILGGQTFIGATMARSNLRDSTESLKNNVTIRFPYTLDPSSPSPPTTQALGDNWRPYPPSDRVFVSCLSAHRGDSQAIIEWTGRVIAPEFTDTECTLTCEPTRSTGRRAGQQQRWQRACWKTLYQCGVLKDDHAVPATVTAVSGLRLTAPEFAALSSDMSLMGGLVEWVREDGLTDYRTITRHVGQTIDLDYGASDLATGLDVIVYPGCAHNWEACETFDNTPNYGGALYLPVKNPMGGMPVW